MSDLIASADRQMFERHGLARTLHAAGQMHGCFYPKHILLREAAAGFEAQLIDLEKPRPLLLGYLGDCAQVDAWWQRLSARRRQKDAR